MADNGKCFLHDADARHDPKLRVLKAAKGKAAVCDYWTVIEILRDQPGYVYKTQWKHAWTALAGELDLSADEARAFVQELCTDFDLLAETEGGFYSPSLTRRMQEWDRRLAKRRDAAKAGGLARQKQLAAEVSAPSVPTLSGSSANAQPTLSVGTITQTLTTTLTETQTPTKTKQPAIEESPPPGFAPLTPAIQTDPRFMGCGQRPLKTYPAIWITPGELAEVKARCEAEGLRDIKPLFQKVQGKLAQPRPPGERPPNAFTWLIGWAFTEFMRETKAALDLRRSQIYLSKAAEA